MRVSPVVPLIFAAGALAQTLADGSTGVAVGVDAVHNATSISGTWSSGSRQVITGAGFVNPANETFIYPNTTGSSYSFTDDGFFEVARYRFNSNGTEPTCFTGVMLWNHGTYDILLNGSIVMHPMGDGFQQVQDPCAARSNFIEDYNITELMSSWRIFTDPTDGFKLHLFKFDGSPESPLFQVSTTPEMLPTQVLRNSSVASVATTTTSSKRSFFARSSGAERPQVAAAAVTLIGAAFLSMLI